MSSRVERLLRWVWLINGVLLLGLLVIGLLFVSGQWILDMTAGDEPVSAPARRDEAGTPPAPVRYDAPRPIRGTDTRIVLVHRGAGSRAGSALSSSSYDARSGTGGAIVNVGFLAADGGRLLLDRPAHISSVRWPGESADADSSGARLRWVVYEMALEDGSGDGRVDHRDARTLYVSDRNGGGLRRVLPDGFLLRSWEVLDDGSLFVSALQGRVGRATDLDRLPARAFLVGADGRARPYASLDSLAAAAERASR